MRCMIISFRECSVPVSSLYLYFASPNWSSLLAITDAPIVSGACSAFVAYASLAFSLRHLVFPARVGKEPECWCYPGGKTHLCFICADICRTRFQVRRSMAVAVSAPPKRTRVRRRSVRLVRRRSVRLVRCRSGRECAAVADTPFTCADEGYASV